MYSNTADWSSSRGLFLSSQCASAAGFRNLQPVVREKTAGLWAGQAVIVWKYAFGTGADVAAFAADSGSLLRVTGRRESAARYKSLSFEFSAATAQGPTLQINKRGPLHTALNSRYGANACGAGCSGSSSK